MNDFEHDKLDVYKISIEFVIISDVTATGLPRGRRYLTDQLRRAASSISLNIAEGAGEFATDEKIRFYRMARRSATESASILDICRSLSLAKPESLQAGRALLLRVVAMLTAMILKLGQSGSDSRAGSGSG